MILNARVKEVTPEKVVYTTKDPATGKMSEHEVDSGFTLWSTGIGKPFSDSDDFEATLTSPFSQP